MFKRVTAVALLAVSLAALCSSARAQFPYAGPLMTSQLPYPIDAFEPSIDEETMMLHWTRHANAFVTNLNSALNATCPRPNLQSASLLDLNMAVGRRCAGGFLRLNFGPDLATLINLSVSSFVDRFGVRRFRNLPKCFAIPAACATPVRNAAGGLWNHGLFFNYNLAPAGSQVYTTDASATLQAAITASFGTFDKFKADFTAASTGVFGSGWAWLVANPRTFRLRIVTTPNQDNPLMDLTNDRGLPILGLDVWEHAYYLKYYNVRPSYVNNFFNVINWRGVSDVYAAIVDGTYGSLDVLKPAPSWNPIAADPGLSATATRRG